MSDNQGVTPPHLQNLGNLPPDSTIDSELDDIFAEVGRIYRTSNLTQLDLDKLDQCKAKLEHKIAQEANKARLDELRQFDNDFYNPWVGYEMEKDVQIQVEIAISFWQALQERIAQLTADKEQA